MKTLLLALTALLMVQVLQLIHYTEEFSFGTDDNFGITADDIMSDLCE